jgi:hypothetical protein
MNSVESRKQLLIAESELNRAQLVQEWQAMAEGFHSISGRAKTVGSVALAVASLVGALMAFRRIQPAPPGTKRPWWQILLKGVQFVGSLWSEFRPQPKS